MVSALWTACSENDLEKVHEVLAAASPADIEIKDQSGTTPLILAVKNGHVEIVKALLDRGANPHNASSEGPAHQFTSDPTILQLLNVSQHPALQPDGHMPAQQPQEPPYGHVDPNMQYWGPPPPNMYGYYPGMHAGPPPPPGPDGSVPYYPPPPPPQHLAEFMNMAPGNLPPPDIARMIPCRYFPACRYGASCMFAHPGQNPAPYYPGGPIPQPGPYSPYDPMSPPTFSPGFYPVSPPTFHPGQPNGAPPAHISPSGQHDGHSPNGLVPHGHPTPDMMSPPPIQSPYSPAGPPPPGVYAPPPQLSPTFSTLPHPQPAIPMPHPQQAPVDAYPAPNGLPVPVPAPAPPFVVQPQPLSPPGDQQNPALLVKPLSAQPQVDGYAPPPMRDGGLGHHRRGSGRRPSFGASRKPPCIFFPSGRCRNGDECRFPHVMPDGAGAPHFGGRGGHRARFSASQGPHGGDMATIEEKFADLTIDPSRQNGGPDANGRSRPPFNGRGANGFAGARADHNKRSGAPAPQYMKQRLPRADEFPVLAGSNVTSPGRVTPPQLNGPTAAQVLQAPAPAKQFRDTATPTVNGNGYAHANGSTEPGSPTSSSGGSLKDVAPTPAVNGVNGSAAPAKLPVSFAAAANGSVNGVETPNQVSVSA